MATVVRTGFDDLIKEFNQIADHSGAMASQAVYAGAGLLADKLRASVESLVTEDVRKHRGKALLPYEKDALERGLTVERFIHDKGRDYTQTAITFHGKTDHRTASYPDGVPTILLARSINAGTTFRSANRYFINTVNRNRKNVETAMVEAAEKELKKYVK